VSATLLHKAELAPTRDFFREIGAPWKFSTDRPGDLFRGIGWSSQETDLRAYAATVGRLLPGSFRDATGFLCFARKRG
jgi:hypothetical protein